MFYVSAICVAVRNLCQRVWAQVRVERYKEWNLIKTSRWYISKHFIIKSHLHVYIFHFCIDDLLYFVVTSKCFSINFIRCHKNRFIFLYNYMFMMQRTICNKVRFLIYSSIIWNLVEKYYWSTTTCVIALWANKCKGFGNVFTCLLYKVLSVGPNIDISTEYMQCSAIVATSKNLKALNHLINQQTWYKLKMGKTSFMCINILQINGGPLGPSYTTI